MKNKSLQKLSKYKSFSQKNILAPSCSTFSPFRNVGGEKIYLYKNKNSQKTKANIKVGKSNFSREQKIEMISKIKRSIKKN